MKIFYGLMICLLLAISPFTYAANIQDINVYTSLNQPLIADIPIVNISVDNFDQMRIALAAPNEFTSANIPFLPWLNQLRFTKIVLARGGFAIRVTTNRPINDPIVYILLRFKVDKQYISKQFTLLLDPPGHGPSYNTALVTNARQFEASGIVIEQPMHNAPKVVEKAPTPEVAPLLPKPADLQKAVLTSQVLPEQRPMSPILAQGVEKSLDNGWIPMLPEWLHTSVTLKPSIKQASQAVKQTTSTTGLAVQTPTNTVPKPVAKPNAPIKTQPTTQNHSLLFALLGLLIVTGLVGWRYRERLLKLEAKLLALLKQHLPSLAKLIKPQAPPVVSPKPERIVTTANTEPAKQAAVKMNTSGDIDPLEEAEILYKYARYEQAEAVLTMAIKKDAKRAELYLKLLEVYGAVQKQDNFKQLVKDIPLQPDTENAIKARIKQLEKKFFGPKPLDDVPQIKNEFITVTLNPEQPVVTGGTVEKIEYINDKIRIAKACIEMQDYHNAQDILEELKNEGTPEQNEEIRQLFKKLPDKNVIDFKLGDE